MLLLLSFNRKRFNLFHNNKNSLCQQITFISACLKSTQYRSVSQGGRSSEEPITTGSRNVKLERSSLNSFYIIEIEGKIEIIASLINLLKPQPRLESQPAAPAVRDWNEKFWSEIREKATEKGIHHMLHKILVKKIIKGQRTLHLLDTDSIDPTEAVSTEAVAGLPPTFDVVDDDDK